MAFKIAGRTALRYVEGTMARIFKTLIPKPGRASAKPAPRPDRPQPGPAVPKTAAQESAPGKPKEVGGPDGPEPTRYGDWERSGICYDF